jgi:TonB-linked SusC/RagA family outer membrane protein
VVNIVGTSARASTNEQGQYTIRGVPTRQVTVQVTRVGFAEQARSISVAAGATATANFALQQQAVQLAEIVTTATGDRRRVEVGNAITQVNAAQLVETRPVANMSDLLTARAPGVQVLPGNSTGTGARVRIRGTSSLSLSSDPIYIIDGVRMQSSTGSSSIGVGGSTPSRVSDINPEEIESIEVVKGPSAATLYGTDAANGVIVIKTKRGRAGKPQWNVYTEQGIIRDLNDYPVAYRGFRSGSSPTTPSGGTQCFLANVARGTCVQDSVTSFNLFADPRATPLGTGRRQQYGVQVNGGSEAVRYFVSGEWEDEVGVLKISEVEMERLGRLQQAGQLPTGILPQWERPNALTRASGRANLNLTLSPKADVAVNTNYIQLNQRLPQNDNNTTGLLSNGFGGPGTRFNTASNGDSLFGFRAFAPGDIFQETVSQNIDRFLGSITGNWRPLEWLSARSNVGVDYTSRVDEDICRRGTCSDFGTSRLGFKIDNRTNFYTYTLDGSAGAEFQPTDWLQTRTTVGVQFYRNIFDRNGASGENLPPGATQVSAGAVLSASESTSESRTLGAFIEENLTFGDRLFVTAGLRSDRNSAFGADFETVLYPKLALSYVVSDEEWFPDFGALNELRFRGAYGASGVQPGTTDAVQFFLGTRARLDNAEVPGVIFSALGNPALKPERSAELELGVDGTFFNNRVNAEVTYYNKRSTDALIARVLPPSLGTGATTRFENIGEVRNWGWEGLLTAQLVQRPSFGWDVTLNGSTNSNKLVELGEGIPPIIGTTVRQVEGFPLNGYWQRPIKSFNDENNDGLIGVNEIVVGDTAEFLGYSIPRHEVAFTNGFDFFNRRARLTALFDYKGGHLLGNGTERIRCQNRQNCRGLIDPTASLEEQARVVALNFHPSRSQGGFLEDASFVRFREVALNLTAPDGWAQRLFRGSSFSVTLSARNLKIWTDYSGLDPESNYGQDDIPNDFQTLPPPSYFTLRLNLGF